MVKSKVEEMPLLAQSAVLALKIHEFLSLNFISIVVEQYFLDSVDYGRI